MDAIEIATREQRIEELEHEVRTLHEEREELQETITQRDDLIIDLKEKAAANYKKQMDGRDTRIKDLGRENNALRKMAAEHLAAARSHRDNYDALCNELGELGLDIPKFRKGLVKVVDA